MSVQALKRLVGSIPMIDKTFAGRAEKNLAVSHGQLTLTTSQIHPLREYHEPSFGKGIETYRQSKSSSILNKDRGHPEGNLAHFLRKSVERSALLRSGETIGIEDLQPLVNSARRIVGARFMERLTDRLLLLCCR